MKQVYVCAPWRGDEIEQIKHLTDTRRRCRNIYREGHMPVAPQLFFSRFLNENIPHERAFGMAAGISALEDCDEIRVYGSRITEGMRSEIEVAERNGIPIIYIEEKE